jgi:hypothetical protein
MGENPAPASLEALQRAVTSLDAGQRAMNCLVMISPAINGLLVNIEPTLLNSPQNTPLSRLPMLALHFSVSFGMMEKSAPLCSATIQNIPVISSHESVRYHSASSSLMEKLTSSCLVDSQSLKNIS